MTKREREIEDLGNFGVFWYRRPTGHTKTGARHRGETPLVTVWTFVRKADGNTWLIHAYNGAFETRDEAIVAAGGILPPYDAIAAATPHPHTCRCYQCERAS